MISQTMPAFPIVDAEDPVFDHGETEDKPMGSSTCGLIMGTSMGAMHSWMFGEMYPDFVDALMPLASAPVEIAGRNRMLRRMVIDSIRDDPEWKNGEYDKPPHGLLSAQYALTMMTSSPLQMLKQLPTREQADAAFDKLKERAWRADANDMLYQFESSTDYNPEPELEKIKARLIAVNSADDQVNPPELGIMEQEIKAREKWAVRTDSDQRSDAGPRHAHRGQIMEAIRGGTSLPP